jgi:hypothetical protein
MGKIRSFGLDGFIDFEALTYIDPFLDSESPKPFGTSKA